MPVTLQNSRTKALLGERRQHYSGSGFCCRAANVAHHSATLLMCIAQVGRESAFAGSSLIAKASAGSDAAVMAATHAKQIPNWWLFRMGAEDCALGHNKLD